MTAEMPIGQDAIQFLRQELAGVSVADEQGWLEYIPLAARLHALGDPGPLERWPELAQAFRGRLESLLIERCERGFGDLENAVGVDLGQAVIDAQDFSCFLQREGDIMPDPSRRMLTAWIEAAERVALDEDAALTLRDFIRRFPLPADDRLANVDVPISSAEESILAAAARPCPIVELAWPSLPLGVSALAEIGQMDAGTPSDRLKQHFERLNFTVEIASIGKFAISRRVNDDWQVVIDVEREPGAVRDIEMVRLGRLPGYQDSDVPGRWLIDLSAWEHMQRVRLMDSPLVVGFQNGQRLRVI